MRGQPIPDEGDLVAVEVTVKLEEELHDGLVVVGARLHGEHESGLGAVGPKADGGRHREALPVVQVVVKDGRLAPLAPRWTSPRGGG